GNVAEEVVLWSAGTETDGKLDVYVEKYKGKSPIVNISNPDDSTIRFVAIKAFYENESIKEVTLPDTVTEIRSQCFAFCENLEKVNLGKGIEEIHSNAFVGCVNLKQVILEDKLKKIEEYAFSLCKSLEEIIIPPSCVEITNNAFAGNSENFKIKGEKGSYAEEFAKANDIPFEEYEFN
ncbi:MAG: leucine-rich repeat domain-containing protein, partial [Clostridia bacterium]|nr:leucine-rich repeat domain-containing protein [Clostridia bacterium]